MSFDAIFDRTWIRGLLAFQEALIHEQRLQGLEPFHNAEVTRFQGLQCENLAKYRHPLESQSDWTEAEITDETLRKEKVKSRQTDILESTAIRFSEKHPQLKEELRNRPYDFQNQIFVMSTMRVNGLPSSLIWYQDVLRSIDTIQKEMERGVTCLSAPPMILTNANIFLSEAQEALENR